MIKNDESQAALSVAKNLEKKVELLMGTAEH